MIRKILTALLLLILPLLVSCSETGASFAVLRGNLLFRGGEDALATYSYLRAKEKASVWEDWIDYDLGTLYISLGEIHPGIRVLTRGVEGFGEAAAQPGRRDRDLFFCSFFNLGVARFEIGQYREAAAAFIQALRLRPDSWDAKINLELSLQSMIKAEAGNRAQAERLQESPEEIKDPQLDELLETIYREERPAWVSAPSQEHFERDW